MTWNKIVNIDWLNRVIEGRDNKRKLSYINIMVNHYADITFKYNLFLNL